MTTTITPYLNFPGNTREVFAFYEKALGGTIDAMLRFADMPSSGTPPEGCGAQYAESGEAIMHASLALPGGARLFGGDTPPSMPDQGFKGVMLALQYDTVEEAKTAFEALSRGGTVQMGLAPSAWSRIFGMVTDRFGVPWAVNGESVAFEPSN